MQGSGDNITISIGADVTKLRAELTIAEQELKSFRSRMNASAKSSLTGGDPEQVLRDAAGYEAQLRSVGQLRTNLAAVNAEHLTTKGHLKEILEHHEKLRGFGRGGVEGLLGGGFLSSPLGTAGIAGAVVAAIGGEAFSLVKEAGEYAHGVETLSFQLDGSTGRLATFKDAAALAGVETEKFDKGMARFALSVEKAAEKQRELTREIAKSGDESGAVARGHESKKRSSDGHFVDVGKMPELKAPTMRFDDPETGFMQPEQGWITAARKAYADRVAGRQAMVDQGQPQPPLEPLSTFLQQQRAKMGSGTKEGDALRDTYFKTGADVPFKNLNDSIDKLGGQGRDVFAKKHLEVTDLKNETIAAEHVFEQFWGTLEKIGKSEALKNLREVMSRAGLDKNLFNLMTHKSEFLGKAETQREAAGLPTKGDDPRIKEGTEVHKDLVTFGVMWDRITRNVGLALAHMTGLGTEGKVAAEAAKDLDKYIGHGDLGIQLSEGDAKGLVDVLKAAASEAAGVAKGITSGENAAATMDSGGGIQGGGAPFAEGGYIRGPGSGTSDSILARVSNGEFVVNAAATSANLALLHSINQGFAAGGLVGWPSLPRFAEGGQVGRTPVHVHMNGREYQMHATESVAGALVAEAHSQHARSAGAKPTWFGR